MSIIRRFTLLGLACAVGLLALTAAPALAAAPTIVSESAPTPKATEVRLEAVINPNGQSTKCEFQYEAGEPLLATPTTVPCEPETIEGLGEQGVGLTVSGLTQATTYYYRVIAKNASSEETKAKIDPFTTALHPETPETLKAELVTGTTATLKGELNPHSTAKDGYYFAYGSGGTCEGFTTTPGAETTETKRTVSTPVTELEGSTEYTFCVVATNEVGEAAFGLPLTFTTSVEKPVVVTEGESGVTPFDATLEGQVNPERQETTYHMEYATDSGFTENVKTLAFGGVGSGVSANQSVGPVDLGGGLTPDTTYYYRVVAKNATGEAKGTVAHPVGEFTTLTAEKPSVTGEKLVGATLSSDTIEAQLNPEYQGVAACEVQYVTEAVFKATGFTENVAAAACSPVPPATEFGQGGSPVAFTATLTGLQENTAYEYRVVASNNTGTVDGTVQSLTRTPPHIAGLPEAIEVTQHTVLIKPSPIDPEIEAPLEATYYILYGTGEANELASARASAGSGLLDKTVASVELYGLEPGTTYHYAVVADNGNATETGPDETFTTAPAEPLTTPPVVGAQSAQFVNEDSAVIQGELNPEGLETTYEVQYGTTAGYGSSAPGPAALAPFTSSQGTITALVGLAPGMTYHYRVAATNRAGASYGQDETFTTAGAARTTVFTSFTIPSVPLIAVTPVVFPAEEPVAKSTPKALTRAQKLAKALKACKKDKSKSKRAKCDKQAHKRYGSAATNVSARKAKKRG
jgi:phosphodiesterase/alkaline phosphatase D-like protein